MKLLFLLLLAILFSANAMAQQTFNSVNVKDLALPSENASSALYLNASGKVKASPGVTSTELEYLSTVSSDIQTQLNAKAADNAVVHLTGNESIAGDKTFTDKISVVSTAKSSHPCPSMTTIQRDVLTPTGGDCVDNSTTGQFERYDSVTLSWQAMGGAGGQGGINYIGNFDAEDTTTTGWVCYADAASSTVEDGTGGSPTGIAISNVASTSLVGTRHFRITKTAGASRLGEGCSYDFTIDTAYRAKVLRIQMPYVSSANFLDTDMRAYIYDVTNSRIIEIDNRDINANTFGHFIASFQTSSDSDSYRLILHSSNETAHTNAWTFDFDDVTVGPATLVKGPVTTDWLSFTPTGSMTTNTTYTGKYRQVGDSAEIEVLVSFAGAPTATTLTVNNPPGLVIDTTKINDTTVNIGGIPGSSAVLYDASAVGTGRLLGNIFYNNSTRVAVGFIQDSNTTEHHIEQFSSTVPITVAVGDKLFMSYTIPIAGWSSNVSLSEDGGQREVVSIYEGSAAVSLSSVPAKITYTTKVRDTTASYSSGTYTVPETGVYKVVVSNVVGSAATVTDQYLISHIYIDGADRANNQARVSSGIAFTQAIVVKEFSLTKGQTIEAYASSTIAASRTTGTSGTNQYISISKNSSPQTLAGGSTYSAKFTSTSGQSIPDITLTTVNWPTQVFNDGLGVMSSGVFTFSLSGTMQVCTNVSLANMSTFNGTSERQILYIFYDADYVARIQSVPPSSSNPTGTTVCSPPFRASRGKSMIIQYYQESGGALSLTTTSWLNNLGVTRVGN